MIVIAFNRNNQRDPLPDVFLGLKKGTDALSQSSESSIRISTIRIGAIYRESIYDWHTNYLNERVSGKFKRVDCTKSIKIYLCFLCNFFNCQFLYLLIISMIILRLTASSVKHFPIIQLLSFYTKYVSNFKTNVWLNIILKFLCDA